MVGGYTESARDSLIEMKFMTKHRNNNVASGNCTISYKHTWWCSCAFNSYGLYFSGSNTSYIYNIIWHN